MRRALALAALAVVLGRSVAATEPAATTEPAAAIAAGEDHPAPTPPILLAGDALERRTSALASKLRCPVCQGLSIDDSPAPSARDMRAVVRQKLAEGMSEEEITAYFVSRYGEFVLLQPEAKGVNLLVWLGPVAILLGGVALAGGFLRRHSRVGRPEGGAPRGTGGTEGGAPATVESDPYLARARALLEGEGKP
ncbi:cytochrome c-type biogenesis protein CcmH [Myxococcota bacterium]|nr:cytochrome c-type biogenesis protein CcmH [Myxococcota bacterium]